MFLTLLMIAATARATCPQTTFEFNGQPDCVELIFEDGRTRVTNACEYPLLVDQSVQLHLERGASSGLIPAQTSAEIQDLNIFTLGMNGRLYQVVAEVAPTPAPCSDAASDDRNAEPDRTK